MTTTASIAGTGASSFDRPAPWRFWLRHAGYGLLLGASIALLEFTYYSPLVSTSGILGADLLFSLLLTWSGEGVLLAVTFGLFEIREAPRPLAARKLALAVLIASTAGVVLWQAFIHLVLREHFGFRVLRDYANQPVDLTSIVLYHVWLMLVFGGLAAAVYFSRQRNARMLAVLRAAELARESTQGRLAETNLAALRARIDPEFLFQTLKKLEHLYETDPAAAARLLEDFIVFLRGALADFRAEESPAAFERIQERGEAFQTR